MNRQIRKGRKIRKGEKLGKVSKYEKGDGAGGCGYRMPLISLDKDAKLGFHIATCLRLIKNYLSSLNTDFRVADLLNIILVVSQTGIGIRQKIRISSKKMV